MIKVFILMFILKYVYLKSIYFWCIISNKSVTIRNYLQNSKYFNDFIKNKVYIYAKPLKN